MTDDQLDPEQEEYLRRLLADARHVDPIPADVADRLDDVLAGLATEEPAEEPTAPVVDLATQQRRRRARQLLVAAAAVVAVGVGISQLDLGSISTQMSADDAGGSSADTAAEDLQSAVEPENSPRRAAPTPTTSKPQVVTDSDLRELGNGSQRSLERDGLRAALDGAFLFDGSRAESYSSADGDQGSKSDETNGRGPQAVASWYACKQGRYGMGRLVAVEYAGNSAVLAVRPSAGDSVVVEVLQCGTATVLRSVTVPTP